jgi:hypothetical protein
MEEHILSQLQSASLRVQGILDESQRLIDELKSRRSRTPPTVCHDISEGEESTETKEQLDDLDVSSSESESEPEKEEGEDDDSDSVCEVEGNRTYCQFFCCRR